MESGEWRVESREQRAESGDVSLRGIFGDLKDEVGGNEKARLLGPGLLGGVEDECSVLAIGEGEFFELAGEGGEGVFDAHALEGTGADEAVGGGFAEDVFDVFGGVDGAAVAEGEDVGVDGFGGVDDVLGDFDGVVPGDDGAGDADAAADGGSDMGDDGIGTLFGHFDGFFRGADVDDGEEVHATGEADHFELFLDGHAGFFEDAAEVAVDDGVGGEVVDAGEAHVFDFAEPVPHAAAGVGGVDAADDGDILDDREDFVFSDVHGDGIGVAIGHHACGGAVAHHAEAAGVVNDDEVGTAFFDEFGGDAGACAAGDDGLTFGEGGVEAVDNFLPCVGVSDSGPGVGHEGGWIKD